MNLDRAVLIKLESLNQFPSEPVEKEEYFMFHKEMLISIAEASVPAISPVSKIEMYLKSADLLLKQARVYEAGGIWGPITDKQIYYIMIHKYHVIFSKLMDHPGYQQMDRF
jgi:hypothetical protein